uniref:HNH homing endonuclease n=1 Tax=Rhabditophanes sp. KR3021 TaxID=114890 RepID=A0AC35TW62_9BILA
MSKQRKMKASILAQHRAKPVKDWGAVLCEILDKQGDGMIYTLQEEGASQIKYFGSSSDENGKASRQTKVKIALHKYDVGYGYGILVDGFTKPNHVLTNSKSNCSMFKKYNNNKPGKSSAVTAEKLVNEHEVMALLSELWTPEHKKVVKATKVINAKRRKGIKIPVGLEEIKRLSDICFRSK